MLLNENQRTSHFSANQGTRVQNGKIKLGLPFVVPDVIYKLGKKNDLLNDNDGVETK